MKKWDKKRVMAAVLALFLALMMVFSVLSGLFYIKASAASRSSVQSLRNKLDDISKKKDSIEKQLKDIKKDKRSINAKKAVLDEQIGVALDEIDTQNELISELTKQISSKETELSAKEEEEQRQYELFKKRVRGMYETGDTGYLSILLSSDNFSDMLSRYEIVSQIMDYDKTLIKEIKTTVSQIQEEKNSLESDKLENESLKTSLVQKSASLKDKSDQSQIMMNQLEQNEEEFRKSYEEYEKEEARIQKQIEAELAALSGKSEYVGGTFLWPAPGYTNISSSYGWRFHPILHVNKLHTGVDISAPTGAAILAANSGTIVTSAYNSAYGNYIIIDHGGGKATLYAHMSKRLIQKGDSVKRGQKIGLVGSTGYATGPHLHFEVRINGSTVNPMSYFTKG
ncbi:MAG: peptidoglycan DD-metalloendopeptidase family protein [Clostridiales bacterium]|nr:peptidoglycan DD-metalloendopeptidase family protein [Clostridiales bacterium]